VRIASSPVSYARLRKGAEVAGTSQEADSSRTHARLQILTLAELFQGKRPDIPWVDASIAKKAKREDTGKQGSLL
jgi:site-specific DNA-methyltransferase (adenine-specific)